MLNNEVKLNINIKICCPCEMHANVVIDFALCCNFDFYISVVELWIFMDCWGLQFQS